MIDFKAFLSQNCQNYGIAACAAIIYRKGDIMKNKLFLLFGLFAVTAFAQDNNSDADVEQVVEVEEITIIGSRIKSKTTLKNEI